MTTKFKQYFWTILILSAAFQLYPQGYIVPNGVTYAGLSLNGIGYGINVTYDPTNGYTTGFSLDPLGETQPTLYTNTYRFDPIVNVGVRAFLTLYDQAITTNTLLSGSLTELLYSPNSGYVFNNGVPFYLALYTGDDQNAPPDGVYDNPLFGWVELENNRGVIEMLGGALEFQGDGIYAGTDNIIPAPEPGELALAALGGLCFAWRRWKKQSL